MRTTTATTTTLALFLGLTVPVLTAQAAAELGEADTVAEWDIDADGNVSQQEFMVTAAAYGISDTESMFMQYDRNGDGVLDGAEQEAFDREATEAEGADTQ
ncbi:MAG: hypothetical protein AAFW01_09690 [Pseudomonadota bacterium]